VLPVREAPASLTVELSKEHRHRTKALAVPGAYWSREGQAYRVDNPDARAAGAIMALFPEALIEYPEIQAIRDAAHGKARPHDYATELGLRLELKNGDLGGITLYDWQDTDGGYLKAILERDGGAHVGWDRGLGKTVVSAAFVQSLKTRRTLIVVRNDAKESVWYAHLAGHYDRNGVWVKGLLEDSHDIWVLPDSTQKSRQRKLLDAVEMFEGNKRPLVLIVHYQSIRTIAGDKTVQHRGGDVSTTKAGGDGWDRLGHWDLMVYDESHRLASYNPNSSKNTQEGKALARLRRKHVKYALNLSGSGVMNHPDDLFGQLHFILPHIYKTKWADWNDQFVDYVKVGPRKTAIGWRLDRLADLHKELGVFMVYRSKEEVFDLPPLIHQDIELPMLPAQQRAYDQMLEEFWALVEGGGLIATSAMDQLNKLRQIATAWPDLPSAKLEFAVNEIEESPDDQFAVFTWYKRPGRLLADRLGDQAVVVDGDVSKKDRVANLAAHERGDARVLIGSIATIGESLNFQYCHEAIRLDRAWNPGVNDQTRDRLYRNGQQARVTFRDLWTPNSVDTLRVRPNLMSKESLRKALYG
jgi:superfamily II DNA or RNA helicase